ncbi:MAG: ABC transporter ATP-binding protein [Gemmatimonadetes bacterium]|nr:ABC transporter ATP-binding protein [Gemmatimonadota bacterium]MYD26670.1 ABC transporter ATP-binding protein [Gemmatimonadota bacterium]MYJ00134.1 ABC transporter ATP-binding protein [Gemmatimonadota bacterium]
MTSNNFAIRTESLTKHYGRIVAVDGLSLTVPRGQIFGLLGPNGSGKTTTMGMLLGLVKPTSGRFRLLDAGISYREALRRTGAIVETPCFYPYLSGRDNLAYFQGISGKSDRGELNELLERVGLADRADDRFRTYSLGMKQRLGLAYVLLGDPEILFLDEPTNGMDPDGMAEIRDLIRTLGTGDRTVLLSSHLLHEVEQVCDSVAILSRGRLIVQGGIHDLVHSLAGDQLRVHTTDNEKAIRILSALDWVGEIIVEDGTILVTAPAERSPELTEALGRSQVYVAEMSAEQMSLEQYYFKVTGGGDGEAG